MRTPRNKASRGSPVAFCKAVWTYPIGPSRQTSPIRSTSSFKSSVGSDADTFQKSSKSTDITRMRTYSITARCSWPSRIKHEHRHRVHSKISYSFRVCPGAVRTYGQCCDPRAESRYRPDRSANRQGRDGVESRVSKLARQSECSWLRRFHRNESHQGRRVQP